jgi:hypothetical protein
METVTFNPLCGVAVGDRPQLGDGRHSAVKGGVKARYLRQFWKSTLQRFDQCDLPGKVIGSYAVMRCNSVRSFGVTRAGSKCFIPCTKRCPTALTEEKIGCDSSQSNRKDTAARWSPAVRRVKACGFPAPAPTVIVAPL